LGIVGAALLDALLRFQGRRLRVAAAVHPK
jgi:hypothetical protein